jgi:hypothetical protein
MDRFTSQIVGRSVEDRDAVEKKSGAVVNTAPFLDPAYSHISAMVYSASNWVTHPERPGIEFTVIHDENASVKLPRGWLQVGDEYWREGDKLCSAAHSPPPIDTPSRERE